MPNGLINLALGLAIQVGTPGPSEQPGFNPPQAAYGRYGSEGSSEPYHPNDSQLNWVHGYHQEIPAYGGHPVFRPYNFTKDRPVAIAYRGRLVREADNALCSTVLAQVPRPGGDVESLAESDRAIALYPRSTHSATTGSTVVPAAVFPTTVVSTATGRLSTTATDVMDRSAQRHARTTGPQLPNSNQQFYWQQQPTLPPVQSSIVIPDSLQAPPIQAAGEFNQINYRR